MEIQIFHHAKNLKIFQKKKKKILSKKQKTFKKPKIQN